MAIDRTCALCGDPAHWDRWTLPPRRRRGLVLRFCTKDCLIEWEEGEDFVKSKEPDKPAKVGRPRIKLTVEMVESAERLYASGHPHQSVADCLGVSLRTLKNWQKRGKDSRLLQDDDKKEEHDLLCEMLVHAHLQGRHQAKKSLLDVVFRSAQAGDWKAARYGLTVLDAENYSTKVIEHKAIMKIEREAQEQERSGSKPPVTPGQIRPVKDVPPIIKEP